VSDRIELAGLRFRARHGVNDDEKVRPQRFEVDLELLADLGAAGRADDLDQTIDYRDVYEATRRIVEGPPFDLIEALAEAIAVELLGAHARIDEVVVRVRKPEVRLGGPLAHAGVEIRRRRRGAEGQAS
jgi:dihydroneopterin aldolase